MTIESNKPPMSNRGVKSPVVVHQPRFDALTATVWNREASELVAIILRAVPQWSPFPIPGGRFYDRGVKLATGEREPSGCFIFWGGTNEFPKVEVTGQATPAVYAALHRDRAEFQVSRLDVAIDMRAPYQFDNYVRAGAAVKTGRGRPVTVSTAGNWLGPWSQDDPAGRTCYFGSRDSRFCRRVYEKGKQIYPGDDAQWDRIRLEVEYKPQKADEKRQAAHLTPEQVIRRDRWACAFLEALGVQGFGTAQPWEAETVVNSLERRLAHMLTQYGPTMSDYSTRHGFEALVGVIRQHIGEESQPDGAMADQP